jgi:AcrR family transcriptional regulator/DNA-binding MarR family transcriptional regulator
MVATAVARRSYGSDVEVAELQRGRLLSATFALVGERGYQGVTARSVSERAGVSTRTFYQCFSDREDCFLAAFSYALDGLESVAKAGWESELGWTARVRAALTALLGTLDREPALRRLVFVEALAAGPLVLARRARVLERLAGVVDQGRANAKSPTMLSPLVAEGVVGATFSVIHARLLEPRPEPLTELAGALMATIVLPYRGAAAAAREQRGTGTFSSGRKNPAGVKSPARLAEGHRAPSIAALRPLGSASPVDYRLTTRARMALAAVADRPGLNNLEVSEVIGLSDQSQVSRMMARLAEQGLVENTQASSKRMAKAWRLTDDGEAVLDAHDFAGRPARGAGEEVRRRRGRVARHGRGHGSTSRQGRRDPETGRASGSSLRMTVLTHEVLVAVADLNAGGSSASNREIARAAGVKDEGQISKLLARLRSHGVLRNSGGSTTRANAWRLTDRGEELLFASATGRERTR